MEGQLALARICLGLFAHEKTTSPAGRSREEDGVIFRCPSGSFHPDPDVHGQTKITFSQHLFNLITSKIT